MRLSLPKLIPLLLLLGACGQDAAPEDDGRAATGEVLEGSISDAMLPLATVRSQPPLLDPQAAATRRAGPGGLPSPEAGDAADGETQPDAGDAGETGAPTPPPAAPEGTGEEGPRAP